MGPIQVAMLAVCLAGSPAHPTTSKQLAQVYVAEAEVYTEPDVTAFVSSTLSRGARLVHLEAFATGWSAIESPPGSFNWIDEAGITLRPFGRAIIQRDGTEVRAGCVGARLPGPPINRLSKGDEVELVSEVAPLVPPRGAQQAKRWLAIRPLPTDRRFVRTNALRLISPLSSPTDPAVAQAQARAADAALSPEIQEELVRIDASRRSMLREPLENWDFKSVLFRYEQLMKSASAAIDREAIKDRVAKVEEDVRFAETSRRFAALLKTSRKRDVEIEQMRHKLTQQKQTASEAFTLVGLIQPSVKEIDGRRLHLLIGADGSTAAYLDIPPGIDLNNLMTQRVGVRGDLRYDETLGARFVIVRDIEPLRTK